MVPIAVTARDGKITSRDRKHAERKIEKLEKYFNGITRIEMILAHDGELALVEIVIHIRRGSQLFCKTSDKDLYAAIDIVLDKAEIQLTKHKEKVKGHHRPARDDSAAEEEASGPEERLEGYDEIVAQRDFGDGAAAGPATKAGAKGARRSGAEPPGRTEAPGKGEAPAKSERGAKGGRSKGR